MLETSCREESDEIYQLLVMSIENLALIVENHRRHGFAVESLPLRQAFGIRVACAREICPAVTHFRRQFNGLFRASCHACMDSRIVEYERDLHAVGTAKDAIQDL